MTTKLKLWRWEICITLKPLAIRVYPHSFPPSLAFTSLSFVPLLLCLRRHHWIRSDLSLEHSNPTVKCDLPSVCVCVLTLASRIMTHIELFMKHLFSLSFTLTFTQWLLSFPASPSSSQLLTASFLVRPYCWALTYIQTHALSACFIHTDTICCICTVQYRSDMFGCVLGDVWRG